MTKPWVVIAACAVCIDWTRLAGTVKGINLKAATVTIQDRSGDLLTIPVDYQVKITEKHGELVDLKRLSLDEKIVLTKTPAEAPKDDAEGLAPPSDPAPHGF